MINQLLEYTSNRSVGFFGIGKSNCSLISEIARGSAKITLRSDEKIDRGTLPCARIFEGENSCRDIDEDVIFFSPSVRRDRRELLCALGRGVEFTSDIEFFLKHNKLPLFVVTGSDGKTTTTFLGAKMLDRSDLPTMAIGNIGEPASLHLGTEKGAFVMEASSFMLEYASPRSKRAAITSLTPEHLSWHYGYDSYKMAKKRAIDNADEAVISADCDDLVKMFADRQLFAVTGVNMSPSQMKSKFRAKYYFGVEDGYITENGRRLIATCRLKKQEIYNIKSYLSALALTKEYTDEDKALSIISTFSGIEHRGEIFLERHGVRFINSSIDTSPTRTAQTLSDIMGNIILLLGGRSKGLDYAPLKKAVNSSKIKKIICFGEAGGEIYSALGKNGVLVEKSLGDAINMALESAEVGDTVLLSPACASYDEFSSFEERGLFFKSRVLSDF